MTSKHVRFDYSKYGVQFGVCENALRGDAEFYGRRAILAVAEYDEWGARASAILAAHAAALLLDDRH